MLVRSNVNVLVEKSIVAFDVKVNDEDEDLDDLFEDIVKIVKDGLTWNKNYQLRDIAFGR